MGNRGIVSVALLAVLSACTPNAPVGEDSAPSPMSSMTDQSSPSVVSPPTPETTRSAGPGYPAGWIRYHQPELRLSFAFPPMDGYTRFEMPFSDSGAGAGRDRYLRFTQIFEEPGPDGGPPADPDPEARTLTFAGGASKRARAGRECEPTDTYLWRRDGERFLIDIAAPGTNCDYEVAPIEVIERADGLGAIVFDLAQYLNAGALPPDTPASTSRDLIAILNLPSEHHRWFKSLTFVFDLDDDRVPNPEPALSDITLADVRRVIRSVALDPEPVIVPAEASSSLDPRNPSGTTLRPLDGRVGDPEGWVRYRSAALGIEVPFPRVPGETREFIHSSHRNRHRLYSWTTWYPGFEPGGKSGYPEHRTVYGFAGGTSAKADDARGCGLTDAAGWTRRGSTYRVLGPNGGCEYDVEDPIDVIRRDDGAAALLFRENEFLDGFCCHGKDLVAILRFPEDHHPEFDAILFHFDNFDDGPTYSRPEPEPALPGFTLEDARTVIHGVRFFPPAEN